MQHLNEYFPPGLDPAYNQQFKKQLAQFLAHSIFISIILLLLITLDRFFKTHARLSCPGAESKICMTISASLQRSSWSCLHWITFRTSTSFGAKIVFFLCDERTIRARNSALPTIMKLNVLEKGAFHSVASLVKNRKHSDIYFLIIDVTFVIATSQLWPKVLALVTSRSSATTAVSWCHLSKC